MGSSGRANQSHELRSDLSVPAYLYYPVTPEGRIDLDAIMRLLQEANRMAHEDLNGAISGIGNKGEIIVEIRGKGAFVIGTLFNDFLSVDLDEAPRRTSESSKERFIELQNLIGTRGTEALREVFKPAMETRDILTLKSISDFVSPDKPPGYVELEERGTSLGFRRLSDIEEVLRDSAHLRRRRFAAAVERIKELVSARRTEEHATSQRARRKVA